MHKELITFVNDVTYVDVIIDCNLRDVNSILQSVRSVLQIYFAQNFKNVLHFYSELLWLQSLVLIS